MSPAVQSAPPSPPGQHPAMLLAALVADLLAAIGRRSWLWRLLPGGAALWRDLQGFADSFITLMHRIANGQPLPPSPTRARRPGRARPPAPPSGRYRPRLPHIHPAQRHATAPRAPAAPRMAAPARARITPPAHSLLTPARGARAALIPPDFSKPRLAARYTLAYFIPISNLYRISAPSGEYLNTPRPCASLRRALREGHSP